MKGESFRGFENFWNSLRMYAKMIRYVIIGSIIFQAILYYFLFFYTFSEYDRYLIYKYYQSKSLNIHHYPASLKLSFNYQSHNKNKLYNLTAKELLLYLSQHNQTVHPLLKKNSLLFVLSFSLYLIIIPLTLSFFSKHGEKLKKDVYLRGSKLIETGDLKKLLPEGRIPIGDILKMPISCETQHLAAAGGPGTGKTVFFNAAIETVIKNGFPCIVYDFKGEFPLIHYRNGDHVFNPLFKNGIKWNLFNEIEENHQIDFIAHSLIPDPPSKSDPYWANSARDVLNAIIKYCIYENKRTHQDLWNVIKIGSKSLKDLASLLSDVPGAEAGYGHIAGEKKSGADVFSTFIQYAKSFELMVRVDGGFSIKEWVKNPQGNIFIPNYASQKETLRPLLSLFIDLLSMNILSLPDDLNRRIFLFKDEFPTLQRLSSIIDLLALGRSKGACVFLGFQDIGQIEHLYGREVRQALITSCGSSLIFRVQDADSAKYFSQKFGEKQSIKTSESESMGVTTTRDGISLNRQEKIEPLLLSSDISNLPDLQAYCKFPGYPATKIQLAASKEQLKKYLFVNEFEVLRNQVIVKKSENNSQDNSIIRKKREIQIIDKNMNESDILNEQIERDNAAESDERDIDDLIR